MRNPASIASFIFIAAVWLAADARADTASGVAYHIADAERFAELFAAGRRDAASLRSAYLDGASAGVDLLYADGIRSAEFMADAVRSWPEDYEKAVDICLPAARAARARVERAIAQVAATLGETRAPQVYVVFGADRLGGTADDEAVVFALEILCMGIETQAEAEALIADVVAHEAVHVYQTQRGGGILFQSMKEGGADFIAQLATGRAVDAERHDWAISREAALWAEFQADVARGCGPCWLYNSNRVEGRPPDLGYWIGKRISEAYYASQTDKAAALRTLMALADEEAILEASGYNPL